MTKFLVVDDYNGNYDEEFDTLEDVFAHFKDEEIVERDSWNKPRIYEIVREVKFVARPTEFSEVNDSPASDIPGPNPGESVTDYAKRITAG